MAKKSAGILVYRQQGSEMQVLLAHPGGPFWAKKDLGVWSIPKGEYTDEAPIDAARREFKEETGMEVKGTLLPLHPIKQKDGKTVHAWAVEMDIDVSKVVSNTFEMEWPPRSGQRKAFPEIDRVEWYSIAEAKEKIIPAQVPLIEELAGE